MQLEALSAIGHDMAALNVVSPSVSTATVSENQFASLVSDGVAQLNADVNKADQMMLDLALGKSVSTHELMMTMQQAKLSMQLAVEVRNKLVDSYQELMRMQL